MKKTLALALLVSGVAGAGPQKFTVDLDGDGRPEVVTLKTYQAEGTTLGQLVVRKDGRLLWAGPRSPQAHGNDPFVFLGEFDLGDVNYVGDYDGDGKVDLIGTAQQSDVRPTRYRIFHWNGRKFVFDRWAMLVPGEGGYVWASYNPEVGQWVEDLKGSPSGIFTAKHMQMQPEPGSHPLRLRWNGHGFDAPH